MAGLSYEQSGVDYDRLDAFKRACQRAAGATAPLLARHGLSEPVGVRGESAYLVDCGDHYLAHVEEGLGTKNLIADAVAKLTGKTAYHAIGVDTVATIVNDMITLGALPVVVAMHLAVGSSDWFDDTARAQALASGFADACTRSGASWGGGETPTLRDIVQPHAAVLAGSAVGRIAPKSLRIVGDVRDGDAIVMLASTGVHTNGLTLCRDLAARVPQGYLTPLTDGRTYGQSLLDPSAIYVDFVSACQQSGLPLHYAVHVTGHGWRKLMRLSQPFVYRITDIGHTPPVLRFIQQQGGLNDEQAYGTFNMGAGFAVYVSDGDVPRCLELARQCGHTAWRAGEIVKQGQRKAVEIAPLGVTFDASSMNLRE